MNDTDQTNTTSEAPVQAPAQQPAQGLGTPQAQDTTGVATPPPPPPPPGTTPLVTPDGQTIQPNYVPPSHPLIVGGDAGLKKESSEGGNNEILTAIQQIKDALTVIEEKLSK